jgi:hypothetical protein
MLDTDIAYIAGIVDGEGCVRIKKTKAYKCQGRTTPGYHASIQIRMVNEEAIRFIAETMGGWYFRQKPSVKTGKPLYCWSMSDQKAEDALRLLLPFLRVKRRQAEAVIRLREIQKDSQKHRIKVTGYRNFPNKYGTQRTVANMSLSDEYIEKCEVLFLEIKGLNKVGRESEPIP